MVGMRMLGRLRIRDECVSREGGKWVGALENVICTLASSQRRFACMRLRLRLLILSGQIKLGQTRLVTTTQVGCVQTPKRPEVGSRSSNNKSRKAISSSISPNFDQRSQTPRSRFRKSEETKSHTIQVKQAS